MGAPSLGRSVKTELPGPRAKEIIARGDFDMQSIYRSIIVDDARSNGVWLADADGNVFLDLFASFALGALGYNHPALTAVAKSDEFLRASINPTSTPFLTTPFWIDFVSEVKARFAPRGMTKMYCVDAGGEGVESAIKAAFIVHAENRRKGAGRSPNPLDLGPAEQQSILDNVGTDAVVVAFSGAFHGRGLGPLSATHSKVVHKADLPAFPWPQVPFPEIKWPLAKFAEDNAAAEAASLRKLEETLERYRDRVAAVIVEPVQSEGGDRHASAAFFRKVQLMTKCAGAALIFDEVQTGCGTAGTLWAHEQFELPEPPDMVTFGKKMQMGGFFASGAYAISQFGRMYQTRNGDRARAMLGLAILRTIEEKGLLASVREVGAHFLDRLESLAESYPTLVSDPRGKGFALAFDMPTAASRDDFLKRTQKRGVLAAYTGSRSVRLRPHLITRREEVDEAVDVFGEVLAEMSA